MAERTGDKIQIKGDYQHQALFSGPAPQRFWHYNKLQHALDLIDINSESRILDAGCGSGLLINLLTKKGFNKITAIDCNKAAIQFASRLHNHPNIAYHTCLFSKAKLPKNSFSSIFFLEVIEHLTASQAKQTIQHFHSLLRPGGKLIISTPNRQSLWPLIEKTLDLFNLVPTLNEAQHEHLYTPQELSHIFQRTGYTTASLKTINTISPWTAVISWRVAQYLNLLETNHNTKWGNIIVACFEKT